MQTEQERFWQGEFGNDYIQRNQSDVLLAANTAFFSKVLANTGPLNSVIELGCNVGMNLRALRQLAPATELSGVEINAAAAEQLRQWGEASVIEDSILSVELPDSYDLTFTKGVLIHINPDFLSAVYRRLYQHSRQYILIAEYYNPTPQMIPYRGNEERLYKRDFAGDMLDTYPDLALVDYGFLYHRDPVFPQDDISWFLLKKT